MRQTREATATEKVWRTPAYTIWALLVGGVFVLARLIRQGWGWIADYHSRAVLTGYTTATLGAVIVGAAVGLLDPMAWRTLSRTSPVRAAVQAAYPEHEGA